MCSFQALANIEATFMDHGLKINDAAALAVESDEEE